MTERFEVPPGLATLSFGDPKNILLDRICPRRFDAAFAKSFWPLVIFVPRLAEEED